MGIVGDNVRKFRGLRQMSQTDLAKKSRVSQPVIAALESGNQETTKRIPLIAAALGVSVSDLDPSYASAQAEIASVMRVHVRGNVQAGIWTEFEEVPSDVTEMIPVVPGRYPNLEQAAFRVRGTSMTKARLFDGDYVVGVPYFMARATIHNGDLVVVERRRGGSVERTVKQIEEGPNGCLLWPRSDDPRFQAPIPCTGPEPDGTEIEITHLVIGSYTPR